MNIGKIPVGMDLIEAKKKVGSFLRSVQNDSKPDKCILYGQPKTSFCNSHSVPRMCLKNIAVDGKVLQVNGLIGADIIDVEKGVNNVSSSFDYEIIERKVGDMYYEGRRQIILFFSNSKLLRYSFLPKGIRLERGQLERAF